MAPSVLITFDIDGTLIKSVGDSANKFHKDAFSYGFKKVFGVDASIDEIPHHGSTDKLVAANTLLNRGFPEQEVQEKIPAMMDAMLEFAHLHKSDAGTGIEILPGVETLLEQLSQDDDILISLVTGNLQDIAWIKMEALGLVGRFSKPHFGGFGSDHTERKELVKIAAERARELGWTGATHWHVGDTPSDVQSAEYGGAHALGVTTGVFKEKDLTESSNGDAVILDGLQDSAKVIELFKTINAKSTIS